METVWLFLFRFFKGTKPPIPGIATISDSAGYRASVSDKAGFLAQVSDRAVNLATVSD